MRVWFLPKLLKCGSQQGPSFRGSLAAVVAVLPCSRRWAAASRDTLQMCFFPSVFHFLRKNDWWLSFALYDSNCWGKFSQHFLMHKNHFESIILLYPLSPQNETKYFLFLGRHFKWMYRSMTLNINLWLNLHKCIFKMIIL